MHVNLNTLKKIVFFFVTIVLFIWQNPKTVAHQTKHEQHPGFPKRDEILIDPR